MAMVDSPAALLTDSSGATLPNEAYTSEAFHRLECERLFAGRWMFAGLVQNFSAPGSVHPLTLAGVPMILVTDTEGAIRGFQNVCRHRGSRLVGEPCRHIKVLTCPYHRWSYDLRGRVLSRPHYHGANQHDTPREPDDKTGLIPVRVDAWHHWLFVNIDGMAPPLAEELAFAESLLSGYRMDELALIRTLEYDVPANWKLVLENFWDPCHSFSIHPQLMGAGTVDNRAAVQWEGQVIYGAVPYDVDVDPSLVPAGAAPRLSGELSTVNRSAWLMLFPNLCLSFFPTNLAVFELHPQGPERTLERLHIYVAKDAATAPEHQRGREQAVALWDETNKQDLEAVKWAQTGRHCPGFDGGALSPYWDGAVGAFAKMVHEALTPAT